MATSKSIELNSKKKIKSKNRFKYGKWGVIFIMPFFITYFIFQLYPLLSSVYNSFFEYYWDDMFFKMIEPKFVGLDNFIKLFKDDHIVRYFGNTLLMWIIGFIPQIVFSLLFASWFTDIRLRLRGTGVIKVILYLPNMLMASSVAVLFFNLFSTTGPINMILTALGNDDPIRFMNTEWGVRGVVALINFIMWTGNTTILLMAGIMGIDLELYEAASIDGASAVQSFKSITLPMLKPILLYVLVTSMIGGLQMFDIPRLLTNVSGGPGGVAMTVVMDLNQRIGTARNYGMAGAESVLLFLAAGILGLFLFKLMESDADKEARAFKKMKKKQAKLEKKSRKDEGGNV